MVRGNEAGGIRGVEGEVEMVSRGQIRAELLYHVKSLNFYPSSQCVSNIPLKYPKRQCGEFRPGGVLSSNSLNVLSLKSCDSCILLHHMSGFFKNIFKCFPESLNKIEA